ncbi:normocyte-binding protein [Paenibacillus tundrae]
MKDIIRDRLNKMEDLEQRSMLKNLMTGVFLNLVEYQETLNKQIEQRVFDEVENQEGKYDIHITLIDREDYDPIHEFLRPMLVSDLDNQTLNISGVAELVRNGGELPLFSMFLEMDTRLIWELILSERVFQGTMITNAGTYPLYFKLQQNLSYLHEIEKLYQSFMLNGMNWRTINLPYLYKFVNCVLIGGDGEPAVHEEVKEIVVLLEEYEVYKRSGVIPLWNLERINQRNTGFPMPAIDRINFEHTLSLRHEGIEHGYLVDASEADVRYILRSEDRLVIVTSRNESGEWGLVKIIKPSMTNLTYFPYPVFTNRRKEQFAVRLAENKGQIIRSKAEILRIVNSLESAEGIELVEIQIHDSMRKGAEFGNASSLTYPLNPFVSDGIRTDHGKPIMKLGFKLEAKDRGRFPEFLEVDVLSFIVAEIQRCFPDYRCEGEYL